MPSEIHFLDKIQVAAPCSASWEEMEGDARKRFCAHCRKSVYNLSDMSRKQAETLIREHEGRLCVTFYRRADGTLLTDNCPAGLRAIRKALVRRVAILASLLVALFHLPGRALAGRLPQSSRQQRHTARPKKQTGKENPQPAATVRTATNAMPARLSRTVPLQQTLLPKSSPPPAQQAASRTTEFRTMGSIGNVF